MIWNPETEPTPGRAAWVHEAMTLNRGVSLLLDREGYVVDAVGACEALLGRSADGLHGMRLIDLAVARDRSGLGGGLAGLMPDQSLEFAILPDHAAVRCRSHWRATRRADGMVLASGVDPGAPAAQIPAIVNLADAVPALIAYIDSEFRYRFANVAYERLANRPRLSLYGCRVEDVFDSSTWTAIEPRMRAALAGEKQVFEESLKLRDGPSINTRTQFIPDRSSDGRVRGFYALIEDVTEYASAIEIMTSVHEAANRTGSDNQATIERLLRIGIAELGVSEGTVSDTRDERYTLRFALPDERIDTDRQDLAITETFCDITLKANEVSATSHAGADERFRCHPAYARAARETYIGVPLYERGSAVGTLSFSADQPRERRFSDLEFGLVRMLGSAIERLLVQDQFERGLYRSRLDMERRAKTDDLTDLLNRGAIFAEFEQLIGFLQVEPREASVALLDLDHFKRVNDTYGHHAGDCVLTEVAETFRQAVREGDLIGRAGGEEFLILLPDVGAAEAEGIMQRLIQRIESLSIEVGPECRIGVTASVGIAECAPALRVDEIYSRADEALYRAKDAGRNRVQRYDSAR
jgi:diguanylate cyclase (GGDEF)-like protein